MKGQTNFLACSLALTQAPVKLRTYDQRFIYHAVHWWRALLPRMRKHLVQNGGPIVMVQVFALG